MRTTWPRSTLRKQSRCAVRARLLGNVGELGAAFHRADRGLRTNAIPLARQRLLAVLLPPTHSRGLRIALPGLGPGAEIVAVPGRTHGQGMKPELLPDAARTLHVFLARQRQRRQ